MHALRSAALGAASLCLVVGIASAQSAPSPDHEDDDELVLYEDDGSLHTLPEQGFPGRRKMGIRMGLSATLSYPLPKLEDARVMGGLRWYYAPRLAQLTPVVEAGLMGGILFGSWGLREHNPIAQEIGGNVRFRLLPLDFVVPYLTVETVLVWSPFADEANTRFGGRFDHGFGVEFGRILMVDAAVSTIVSEYESEGETRYATIGGSATVSFEFCSLAKAGACEYAPPKPRLDDHTCNLYDQAVDLCAKKLPGSNLCQAVDEALDTYEHPLMGRDAVTAFLESALESANAEAARILNPLLDTHRKERHWLEDFRRAKREAVIQGKSLAVIRRYAPYPVEIAHALGCDGAKTCENVCARR